MQLLLDKVITGGGTTGWLWVGSSAELLVRALPTSGNAYWEHNTKQSDTNAVKWDEGDVTTATETLLLKGQYIRGTASGNCTFEVYASET